MNTSRHLRVIPDAAEEGASGAPPSAWRDVTLASVVVVILIVGIAGGALSPESSAELQIPAAHPYQEWPSAARERDLVYVPARYVNQATEIEEHIPAF